MSVVSRLTSAKRSSGSLISLNPFDGTRRLDEVQGGSSRLHPRGLGDYYYPALRLARDGSGGLEILPGIRERTVVQGPADRVGDRRLGPRGEIGDDLGLDRVTNRHSRRVARR